jgi:hypothetical protein
MPAPIGALLRRTLALSDGMSSLVEAGQMRLCAPPLLWASPEPPMSQPPEADAAALAAIAALDSLLPPGAFDCSTFDCSALDRAAAALPPRGAALALLRMLRDSPTRALPAALALSAAGSAIPRSAAAVDGLLEAMVSDSTHLALVRGVFSALRESLCVSGQCSLPEASCACVSSALCDAMLPPGCVGPASVALGVSLAVLLWEEPPMPWTPPEIPLQQESLAEDDTSATEITEPQSVAPPPTLAAAVGASWFDQVAPPSPLRAAAEGGVPSMREVDSLLEAVGQMAPASEDEGGVGEGPQMPPPPPPPPVVPPPPPPPPPVDLLG